MRASGELARGLLQQRPRLRAELLAPLRVEARAGELAAEAARVGLVDRHPTARQLLREPLVAQRGVAPLQDGVLGEVPLDDPLHLARQRLPRLLVAQDVVPR